MEICQKIWSKLMHLRLRPIRVLCFHQVSEVFDSAKMWDCDWMSTTRFIQLVEEIQSDGYTFISLKEAHQHLEKDIFRRRKYAVLTADDGSKTLNNIMPWLQSKHIPLTIFINGSYLDGKTYRESPSEEYLTEEEVFALIDNDIEIGNHSWDHRDLSNMTKAEFEQSIRKNVGLLSTHPCYIPFWAYPYGSHTKISDKILKDHGIVPVLLNGEKNYNNPNIINREVLGLEKWTKS